MLLERHQIRHHLAGMRPPRQPVDDGNGGVRGKLQQRIVVENADHDGIDVTRQYPRGVGDGLAAPELHFRTGQHDRFTAELAHADVERHPGAGRGLFENHRQRLALERLDRFGILFFLRLQLRLHGDAGGEHVAELPGRKLAEIEKMPQRLAQCPAVRFCWSPESAVQGRSRLATDSSISASVTISGGRNRTTFSPAPTVSSFWSRKAATRSPDGTTAFRPISSPSPRTSASTFGWRSTTEGSFCLSSSDILCACSKKPGFSITSSTAFAAAVARHAPIGKPPPSAFASGITSGVTPRRL